MLRKRKAQGLSITTIIVAVIGLVILVVLIAIFTGRFGVFTSGVEGASSCDNFCGSLGMDVIGNVPDGGACNQGETKISDCCCEKLTCEEKCDKKQEDCQKDCDEKYSGPPRGGCRADCTTEKNECLVPC